MIIITKFLTQNDKKDYENWHENRYNKDLILSEELVKRDENWSIIIGYYSMHNITKLFLTKYNIYLYGGEHIHDRCIEELEKISIKEEKYLKDQLFLLKQAKDTSEKLLEKPKDWPGILETAKNERTTANYYKQRDIIGANEFLERYVKPYIDTIKKMIKK